MSRREFTKYLANEETALQFMRLLDYMYITCEHPKSYPGYWAVSFWADKSTGQWLLAMPEHAVPGNNRKAA